MSISGHERKILKLFAKKINPVDPGAHNNLAVVYYNKGLIKEAVEELKKALEIEPRFTLAKNNIDYIYRITGYYDEDIEHLKKGIDENPDDLTTRLELARAYKNTGNYFEALINYRKYLCEKSNDIDALLEMGITCKAIGFYESAIEQFKKIIRLRDKFAPAHKHLGEVYYNVGIFSQAIRELKKAIKIKPDDAESYYLLAFAYGEEGKFDKAKGLAKKAVSLNPRYAKAEPNLGLGMYRQKGYEDSLAVSQEEIEKRPFFVHYAMGLTYKNKGLLEEALSELKKAEKEDPDNSLAKEQIGEVYLFLGKNADAIEAYSDALKYESDFPKIFNNIGIAYHRSGRLEEAISWYEKAISRDENYAVSWNNLGVVNYHYGNPSRAFKCFRRAKELNPEYPDPYLNIGLIYMSKGSYNKAEELFKKVIEMKEEYPLPYNHLGSVYLNSERFEEAIHQFQQAIERDDSFSEAYYNLGFALSRIGKYDAALEATKKAMEINPFYTSNRFKLGLDIYSEKLDILVAREFTEEMEIREEVTEGVMEEEIFENLFKGADKPTKKINISEVIKRAESLYKENQLNEALELLGEIRQHDADNPEILILLGKIYKEKKLWGEARDVLVGLIPYNEEAVRILATVYIEIDEWENARNMAKIIREKDASDPFSYLIAARYLEHKKQYKKARYLLKSCPHWKEKSDILSQIASLYFISGKRDWAYRYVKESLLLSPSASGYLLLARIWIQKGDIKKSEACLLKAIKLYPDNSKIHSLLVKIRFKLKDYHGTIDAALRAKRVLKADSNLSLWMGKAYYQMGRFSKAIAVLKQAISFNKKNIKAYQALASIYFRMGRFNMAENLWEMIIDKTGDSKEAEKAKEAIGNLLRLKKLTGDI